jgi:hypothetical protein
MKSKNRQNTTTKEASNAERSDCGESDFNILIELDESEMAQVGGGNKHGDKATPILAYPNQG